MLFAPGKRPNSAAIRKFASINRSTLLSHDPSRDTPVHLVSVNGENLDGPDQISSCLKEPIWVELLCDGLTFDLVGLTPGPASNFAEFVHRFDLNVSPTGRRFEPMVLLPSTHLVGGARSLPVMQGLCKVARDLVHNFEAIEAVVWPPAASAIGRRYFESVVTAWLEGGPFPALGLTSFRETMDGSLESVGLEFLLGQELRIEPPLSVNKVDATRLGVRLVNQLIAMGGLDQSERLISPDGSRLVMRPSANKRFIRVTPE